LHPTYLFLRQDASRDLHLELFRSFIFLENYPWTSLEHLLVMTADSIFALNLHLKNFLTGKF